jgi:hypothetical protein
MTVPNISYDEKAAERAFSRHSALVKAERDDPSLAMEPAFVEMRERAYATFCKVFGAPAR